MPCVSPSACACLVDITNTFLLAFQEPPEHRRAEFCAIADAELHTALHCVSTSALNLRRENHLLYSEFDSDTAWHPCKLFSMPKRLF